MHRLPGHLLEEIVPLSTVCTQDEGPRADTSMEALAKLKPVFHAQGTVTAGNSSQMSDGAAAALWSCPSRRLANWA